MALRVLSCFCSSVRGTPSSSSSAPAKTATNASLSMSGPGGKRLPRRGRWQNGIHSWALRP
eukprot:6258651-Pyramimonas_sp.AAC.1